MAAWLLLALAVVKAGYGKIDLHSLALPDPLRTGAYRLEIISAVLTS